MQPLKLRLYSNRNRIVPKIDVIFLKQTIKWVAISSLFSLVVSILSSFQYHKSFDQNVLHNTELSSIKQKSQKTLEDLLILQRSLPRFMDMKKSGLIGEEDRLNWLEVLSETVKDLHTEKIEYRIDEQKPFEDPKIEITGNYQVFSSQMHLSTLLLHEGDFLKIIDTLKTKANGLFHINECEFIRLQQQSKTSVASNISAQCSLTWFTIRYKNDRHSEVET